MIIWRITHSVNSLRLSSPARKTGMRIGSKARWLEQSFSQTDPRPSKQLRTEYTKSENLGQLWTVLYASPGRDMSNLTANMSLGRNYWCTKMSIVTDGKASLPDLLSCEVSSALTDKCVSVLERLGARNKLKTIWTPTRNQPEWATRKKQMVLICQTKIGLRNSLSADKAGNQKSGNKAPT